MGDCNFVSGSCTSVTKGKIFKTQLFGQMKTHLNLMAQVIGIIVCNCVILRGASGEISSFYNLSARLLIFNTHIPPIINTHTSKFRS